MTDLHESDFDAAVRRVDELARQGHGDFRVIIREAQPHERREIEARTASGESIASDACIAVWLGARLVGWGDDYGTFRVLPAPTSAGLLERRGERLLEAFTEFWEAAQK